MRLPWMAKRELSPSRFRRALRGMWGVKLGWPSQACSGVPWLVVKRPPRLLEHQQQHRGLVLERFYKWCVLCHGVFSDSFFCQPRVVDMF